MEQELELLPRYPVSTGAEQLRSGQTKFQDLVNHKVQANEVLSHHTQPSRLSEETHPLGDLRCEMGHDRMSG